MAGGMGRCRSTAPRRLGRFGVFCFALCWPSGASAAEGTGPDPAPAAGEALADEELTVTAERLPASAEERDRIYAELAKARRLYRRNRIKEALPYLERTAKSGFKDSQAKMGHILLQGLGEVERDSLSAVGWLGVASSGETSPTIRNYFNDIWERIPDRHVPVFEEAVQEYTSRYGAHVTGVVCEMKRSAGSHLKSLSCYFEADLDDETRRGLDARRVQDARSAVQRARERWMLDCYAAGGAINPQCVP